MYSCSGVFVNHSRVKLHCRGRTIRKRCRRLASFTCHANLPSNHSVSSNNDNTNQSETTVAADTATNDRFKVQESVSVQSSTIDVTFRLPFRAREHERLVLSGNSPEFGNWKLSEAYPLIRTPGDIWTAKMRLKSGVYEFKCVRMGRHYADWECGENRILHLEETYSIGSEMQVTMEFGVTRFSDTLRTICETLVIAADKNAR